MKPQLPSHEDIARRAREIWISRGNPSGYDIGHWLEAERALAVDAIAALPAADQTHTAGALTESGKQPGNNPLAP